MSTTLVEDNRERDIWIKIEREQQVVAAAGLLLSSFLPLLPPQSIHFCSIRRVTAVNWTACSPLSLCTFLYFLSHLKLSAALI